MTHFLLRQAALWLALLFGFGHDIEGARNVAVALTLLYFLAAVASLDDLNVAELAKRGPSAAPPALMAALDIAAAALFVWNGYWITGLLQFIAAAAIDQLQVKLEQLREGRS